MIDNIYFLKEFAALLRYNWCTKCTNFLLQIEFWIYIWAFLMAQMVKICLQCRRPGFNPRIRKMLHRRECQPTQVFLLGESPWTEKPDWLWSRGHKESDTTKRLKHTAYMYHFSSVQSLRHVWLFATPWIAAHQASLSITNSRSSLRLTSIKSVMPSSHLILCCPLLLLPPIPPSIRVFSNESALCMRWPKYWSFSFSIIRSKEFPGLISFRMDWLDLLAVQGTLKSLLQHHSSEASILA